jgi:hypothetical protein
MAAVGTVTAAMIATNADLAAAQLTGHQSRTSAPAGFRHRLDRIGDQMSAAIDRVPIKPVGSTQLPIAAFHERVAALSADQLGTVYRAVPPAMWNSIDKTVNQLPAVVMRPASSLLPAHRAETHFSVPNAPADLPAEPEEPDCRIIEDPVGIGLQKGAFSAHTIARFLRMVSSYLPKTVLEVPVGGILKAIATGFDILGASFEITIETSNQCYDQLRENFAEFAVEAYKGIREFDEPLLQGQETISKAIADLLAGAAGGFDTTDKEIADLTAAHQKVTASTNDQLHIRVETELLSEHPAVAAELPVSAGGYLDAQPVGVQQVVTAALADATKAHQPISSAAPRNLAIADAALAAGEYKKAFHYYQLVYQAVIQ